MAYYRRTRNSYNGPKAEIVRIDPPKLISREPENGHGWEPENGRGREPGNVHGREAGNGRGREAGNGYGREAENGHRCEAGNGYGREPGDGRGREPGNVHGREAGNGRGREAGNDPEPGKRAGEIIHKNPFSGFNGIFDFIKNIDMEDILLIALILLFLNMEDDEYIMMVPALIYILMG